MKTDQEYIKDLSEIRSMMERSTKFLSLSGLSGILAGLYALVAAYIAYRFFFADSGGFSDINISGQDISGNLFSLILLALVVLLLAIGTAAYLSHKKARRNNEVLWNPVARRLAFNMAIPLITGGILILILISRDIFGLIAPLTLIFYGLALINASKFTFGELKSLGITEIILGLISSYFVDLGLLLWAVGFGIMHIAYGIYMHLKYEK